MVQYTDRVHSLLYRHYQKLASRYRPCGPFLEIGASPGGKAILAGSYFKNFPDRFAINLNGLAQEDGIRFQQCNSNQMQSIFEDGRFRTVLSNAVLEHDKRFWLSIAEMRRVLAPGGLMFIGVPAFIPRSQTCANILGLGVEPKATITYDVHAKPDYWRFSRQAVSEVMCDGLEMLEMKVVGAIPRLVAVARKPMA